MHKINVDDMFSGKSSRYALVIAVAKRAREITQEQEEEGIISDEKPVLTAIEEFKQHKFNILEDEDEE
ncbi:MAG: DNA-directed RNA polymerase subunit omega [Oscillospiraceae bacterium]|nr:DNA-directed RNA polymerase subunit omega [Oscillospiraceae bacterium]